MYTSPLPPEHTIEQEDVPCEICGQDARVLVAWQFDLTLGGNTIYSMHECQGCGVIYQHPRPTPAAMELLYPSSYPQYTRGLHTRSRLYRIDRRYGLRKRCKAVLRHVKHGRLLDVGCATGDFLSEMMQLPGWSVVGLEPSKFAAHYAHTEVGVDMVQGILNTAPFTIPSFDVITFWDVLEHVYEPRTVIQMAAQLLHPGGILIINHPNLESIDRRLFGRFWIGYELPRHLYLFPSRLLSELMAESGLYEVEQRCIYGSHAATSTSLIRAIKGLLGSSRLSQLVQKIAFNLICRIMLVPYFKIIDHYRLGSNVMIVFKKLSA